MEIRRIFFDMALVAACLSCSGGADKPLDRGVHLLLSKRSDAVIFLALVKLAGFAQYIQNYFAKTESVAFS